MTAEGMHPLLKDWIQALSWGVAIIGGLIAAFVAISQLKASTEQRKRELRWQQTKAGKELVDCLFDEPKSSKALTMIDSPGKSYQEIPGNDKAVQSQDVLKALEVKKASESQLVFTHNDDKSIFIRECFDELFYYLERFQYFVENGLVDFQDVRVPAEYYVRRMGSNKGYYLNYSRSIKYDRAAQFLEDLQQNSSDKTDV